MNAIPIPEYVLPELRDDVRRALAAPPALASSIRQQMKFASAAAMQFSNVGRVIEAAVFFAVACTISEQINGPDHSDTLSCRNNLAESYRVAGKLRAAIELLEQSVRDSSRVLGRDHPDTLTSRSNLALSYRDAGRLQASIQLEEQLVKDRTPVLRPDHPDTFTSRNILAESYRAAGRLKEAIVLHEQLVRDSSRVLGRDHPDTLTSRSNLALSYHDAGGWQVAIEFLAQLVRDSSRVLGANHPDTLRSRSNLGRCYHAQGRLQEAIELEEQLVQDCTHVLGPHHPQTLASRINLALSWTKSGDLTRGAEQLTLSLEGLQRIRQLGGDAAGRAMTAQTLGMDIVALLLAALRCRLNEPVERVVEAIERGTGRSVLDLLQRRSETGETLAAQRVAEGHWSTEQLESYVRDVQRVTELEARQRLLIESGEFSAERQQLDAELCTVRTRLLQMERELLPSAEPKPLAEIRGRLQPGELLLLYGWCAFGVTLVVIPAKDEGTPQAIWISAVARQAGESPYQCMQRERDRILSAHRDAQVAQAGLLGSSPLTEGREAARRLLDFVLPPAVRELVGRAERVIVVPSGPLHEVALDVLAEVAEVPELMNKPVATAPSASIFAMLRAHGRVTGRYWPGVVGDPDFGPLEPGGEVQRSWSELSLLTRGDEHKLHRLPRARLEAETIAGYFRELDPRSNARALVNGEATIPRVYVEARGKRVLHLSAHAILAAIDDPLGSAVVLAKDADGKAGLLRVDDLLTQWAHHLKGCDLVVLSCCDTGRGVKLGDSLMGLCRSRSSTRAPGAYWRACGRSMTRPHGC